MINLTVRLGVIYIIVSIINDIKFFWFTVVIQHKFLCSLQHIGYSIGFWQGVHTTLRITGFLHFVYYLVFSITRKPNVSETGYFHFQVRGGRHLLCCVPQKQINSITGYNGMLSVCVQMDDCSSYWLSSFCEWDFYKYQTYFCLQTIWSFLFHITLNDSVIWCTVKCIQNAIHCDLSWIIYNEIAIHPCYDIWYTNCQVYV